MIWLSSFPRSGNTYLRNILFEVYGLNSSTFHREASYPLDRDFREFPFVKTHELPSTLEEFDSDIPVVYLLRDGRDSVCSLAHHRTDLVAPGSDFYQNLKEAIVADKGSFFGGWSRNVEEWLDRADLIIRYEDLIKDPVASVERIRAFYPLPEPKIEKLPTFEQLKFGMPKYGSGAGRAISDREKLEHSNKFFRKGKPGGWADDMPDELHDLYWSYHGDTMGKVGYSRSGEIFEPDPELDTAIAAKLGKIPVYRDYKKYKILIEGDKLLSSDNDGVKRYQVELLKSIFPITGNPHSSWQIDVYLDGKTVPLIDCKDILSKNFRTEKSLVENVSSNAFLRMERALVALVPRRFVNFLQDHNIFWFHYIYEKIRKLVLEFSALLSPSHGSESDEKPLNNGGITPNIGDKYDLIHIPLKQHCSPFRGTTCKTLVTVHDLTHLHLPEFHTVLNRANADQGMQFVVENAADLIAISQSTKNDILSKTAIPEHRVHLVYEAADRKKFNFKINKDDCRNVREKYGIDLYAPYIICLSTIEPRKNLKNTIRAYSLLIEENPNIPLILVIAGKKGWSANHIYSEAKGQRERIHFTGFVDDDDLAFLYSDAIAMSYLSFYEGFGLPPLEAMCCGTPVIFGNNSSLIEVVGTGGLAADSYDIEDIKVQYKKIFYDTELRAEKSRAALRQSLRFSWRQVAIETLALYKKIIDGHR